jgi:bifunctional DNA-binding transcriptional regulator/antitoxin component of YhaV-PrlF toxin-antitoxin module
MSNEKPPAASHVTDSFRRLLDRVNMEPFELTIDARGRIQVPRDVREKMLAGKAGPVIAEVVDGELRLITPKAAIRKVKRLISEQDWGTDSGVDQLILERRAEALREYAESLLPTSER